MPLPSSTTSTPPSARRVTEILVQWPAMASSTELSTTSQTRWCRPRGPVVPMYIPGRRRTASRPSRTVMSEASYRVERLRGGAALDEPADRVDRDAADLRAPDAGDRVVFRVVFLGGFLLANHPPCGTR